MLNSLDISQGLPCVTDFSFPLFLGGGVDIGKEKAIQKDPVESENINCCREESKKEGGKEETSAHYFSLSIAPI